MRVNIYGEELTEKIEIVRKAVNQQTFVGIRFYFKSHPDLHHSEGDNDESAITFWAPWTRKTGNQTAIVSRLMERAADAIGRIGPDGL